MFQDRKDAALQLAKALEKYKGTHALVLGIPRGGVETAYYIARYLDAELSILVSRKLGHPANPELAIGAIAEDGSIYLRPQVKRELTEEIIQSITEEQKKEIRRRIKILRKGKPLPPIKNRIVILTDDGIATGATIFAAIEMCKNQGARKIIVAAPVSAIDTKETLEQMADEVVILDLPEFYYAVSQVYLSFYQLSDEDSIDFLERWQKEKDSSTT